MSEGAFVNQKPKHDVLTLKKKRVVSCLVVRKFGAALRLTLEVDAQLVHVIIGLCNAHAFKLANYVGCEVRMAGVVLKNGQGAARFGAKADGYEFYLIHGFETGRVADVAEHLFDNGIALLSWSLYLGLIAAAGKTGKRQQEYGYEGQKGFGELHRFHGWLVWSF